MLQTSAFISTINQATIYQNSKCVLILHVFFSLELVNQPVSEGDVAKHPQGEGPGYHNSKDEICVRLHFLAILSYIYPVSILEDLQSISFSSNSFSLLVQIILNSWLRIIFHDDQISNSSNSWNIISPHTLITLVNLPQLSADSSEKDPSASLQRFPQDVDK